MKIFLRTVFLTLAMAFASIANAGLINWNDIEDGTVEIQSGASYLTNGIFSLVPPVVLSGGTDDLNFLSSAAGYTESKTGNVENISQIWDFSNGSVALFFGMKLDLIFELSSQVGNISNFIGTARLSDDIGYVDLFISGIHTNLINNQGYQYGTFAGLLSVDNSNISNPNPTTSVPEPSTLILFVLCVIGLAYRKKFV